MRIIALAALCVALTGCGTAGIGRDNSFSKAALDNIKECSRDYTISFDPIPRGTIRASCEPQSVVRARAAEAPEAPVE